ncbi:hypothetical protein LG634_06905 [Streptomyces bambusae]|uniref:hypothetical protein n=1 Tax=Streptomyces bambusae TaxID=1550616 RepID=UPI001CFF41CB|nr:hypothetical protein [Streptomyces bambusae]MCB5164562.1 hypothetical protein [Streptomyces bambusae]
MPTTIAACVESGSFFDLNRDDPVLTQLRENGSEHALPFALMEHLVKSGTPYAEHARTLAADPVPVDGAVFDWFDGALHEQLAKEVNLETYGILEHTVARRTDLTRALERIASIHPEGFARVREFVRGLLWVGLKPGTGGSSLTSSSDPALPYVVMFSEKALLHIPPNTVSTEPSPRFLAENILHEAVHQSVSFHILQRSVFANGYSAKASPKIEIAWRAASEERNQFWEIDRTFHATCVYNQLLRFRRTELDREDLNENERACFQAAYGEGMPAVRYLMDQLERNAEHFTPHGQALLADLRHQTDGL